MLKIVNLQKSFGNKKVLKGIDLNVKSGEIIGIIGPSGCGKSTLLRSINYLEKPTHGQIFLNDDEIDERDNLNDLRRKIGMVFQQFNLFNNLTVLDNIILAPVKQKVMNKKDATKEAIRLLKKIDLYDKKDSYPRELSGGQRQRIAIISRENGNEKGKICPSGRSSHQQNHLYDSPFGQLLQQGNVRIFRKGHKENL